MNRIPPAEGNPHKREPEQDTGLRYSFAGLIPEMRDQIIAHPTGKTRVISYPKPQPAERAVRDELQRAGRLLGSSLEENHEVSTFKIPVSSRPIMYDAQSLARGQFSYGDEKMIFDMGRLLGGTAHENGYLIAGKVVKKIAFVEFTRPGERQLFLLPGVEADILPIPDDLDVHGHYAADLEKTCGTRFTRFSEYFSAGFWEA